MYHVGTGGINSVLVLTIYRLWRPGLPVTEEQLVVIRNALKECRPDRIIVKPEMDLYFLWVDGRGSMTNEWGIALDNSSGDI